MFRELRDIGEILLLGLISLLAVAVPLALIIGGVKLVDSGHYIWAGVLFLPIGLLVLYILGNIVDDI